MDSQRHRRIREVLQEAGRLPEERRHDYLAQVEPDVRKEVERLLHADVPTGDLFPEPAPAPDTVGPYEVVRELGRGGMGVVYEATRAGQRVAIKVIYPHLPRERFRREARLGQAVEHENVVRTLDAGDDYLVMEYVEGRTLRQLAQEWGTIPETLLREIARQAAAGLRAIHDAGIVHRDLKPENILIDGEQRVRIMDLGIAKVQQATVQLTGEGQFLGSMYYAAPEQWEAARAVGPEADLYSLGVLLYELATGVNPFRADTPGGVIRAHLDFDPAPATELVTEISPFFAELAQALMAKQPADRHVGDAFETAESGTWWAERRRAQVRPRVPVARPTPLRGREDELAVLREAWRKRSGSILIEGEEGLGKTRLIDEFLRGLGKDAHILYGAFTPGGGSAGLTDPLREKFGTEEGLRPYLATTPRVVSDFVAFLRRESVDPFPGDILQGVCCNLLQALTAEKPTVWIMEDLQHAPADARAVARALARTERGLLIFSGPAGLDFNGVERLALQRLSPRHVVALARDVGHDEERGREIARKADGVPLFALEMARAKETQIPSAIRDVVGARLRVLGTDERALLDVAAVQGNDFDAGVVARVLERPLVKVLQDLAHIERQHGLIRAAGRDYRFDHRLLQEALYEELPPRLREEYHALVAEARENADDFFRAWHHLHGSAPQSAMPHVQPALEELRAYSRYEDVAVIADLALPHLEGDARARTLKGLAFAAQMLGRTDRARTAYDEARGLAKDPNLRGLILEEMCDFFTRNSQLEEAQAVFAEARDLDVDRATASGIAGAGAILYMRLGFHDKARELAESQLQTARECGDRRREAIALSRLGVIAAAQNRFPEAEEYYHQTLAICSEIGARLTEAITFGNLGVAAWRRGHGAEALERYQRYHDLSHELAYRQGEAIGLFNLSRVWECFGRPDKAEAMLQRALRLADELGRPHLRALVLMNMGHLKRDPDLLRQAFEIYREAGDAGPAALCLVYLGELDEAIRLAREAEARNNLMLALAYKGEVEEAHGILDEHGQNLGHRTKMEARYALWKATGDRRDLEEAQRLLLEMRDHAPQEYRVPMIENVPLHREIQDAAAAAE